jgi:hypothetical protein
MNHLANAKTQLTLLKAGATAGETLTGSVDCLGADFVTILCQMSTSNTVSNNPTTLKISESDITDATGYADITALVGDGVGGFVVANADTANQNQYRFNIDCRARKRYLKLTVSPLTTQTVNMTAILSKLNQSVDGSATSSGVTQVING